MVEPAPKPAAPAERLIAAAGASCVAAVMVNPFDVIKTRMQAQAVGGTSCAAPQMQQPLFEYGMQSVLRGLPTMSEKVHKLIVFKQPASDTFHPSSLPWLHRRWAIASCPACAAPSATCTASFMPQPSMLDTFRKIVQHEGVPVLWRGSLASLAMSVPMVGIYMPLYDHLLALTSPTGAAAPILAGTISRTVAIYCVAPLELARTRLQASSQPNVSALRMLTDMANPRQSTAHSHTPMTNPAPTTPAEPAPAGASPAGAGSRAAGTATTAGHSVNSDARSATSASRLGQTPDNVASPSNTGGRPSTGAGTTAGASARVFASEGMRTVARSIPNLWRGVNATLSRDVPFSALYWGMLEPTRQELLHGQGWKSADHGLASANFVAGFVCGGSAAAITTPLDVVKTRHQLAVDGKQSVWGTLKEVYGQQGLRGLYRGVAPRSSRAAPACGIVVATYEILKDWMVSRRM